jgi:hypothetical protein
MCCGSFASISSTSTGCGSRRADFSVSPIARPNDVSTSSAPCSWSEAAAAYAIDSRVSTPVTSSFLPSSSIATPFGAMLAGFRWRTAERLSDVLRSRPGSRELNRP